MTTVRIDQRFRGPDTSGNGGYSCGVLARVLDGPSEVTLRSPPPLDRDLQLQSDGNTATLTDGGTVIGTAQCLEGFDLDIPVRPTMDQAIAASRRYAGFQHHLYPECFVCGPDRKPHDGLRIFTGPDSEARVVAGPWIPEEDYADSDQHVRAEFIWSALDCPGYFGLMKPGLPALLGRMSAIVKTRIPIATPCIVIGWHIGSDGRKHSAGSALLGADGTTFAVAKSLWIELKQ